MPKLVENLRALVTGGGTGLGLATAQRLLEHGAMVTIVGRREEVLEQAVETLTPFVNGGAIHSMVCDATNEEQLAAACAMAAGDDKRLDILVANAGTGMPSPITSMDIDTWRYVYDVNVFGIALSIKHATPYMPHGSSIVTLSSTAGVKVEKWMSTYSSSKAAVEMLTRCAAVELAAKGIRVNSIRPGWHTTEMNESSFSPEMRDAVIKDTLLGRPGEPEEIGDAVVWLGSKMSSFVTGAVLGIDGGLGVAQGEDFESIARMVVGDEVMDKAVSGNW